MLVREKLETENLSGNEAAIAAYMLKYGMQIADMTTKQLAKETYTSPATLVRLAHKLGYDGWNELKSAFLQEQSYLDSHFFEIDPNYPFEKTDSRIQIAGKIASLEEETIRDTQNLLTDKDLYEAVKILAKARNIYIITVANNIPEAELFAINLSRIGRPALVCTMQGEPQYFSRLATKEDCALVISYSGETEIPLKCTHYFYEQHIPLIAMTNIGENSVAELADVVLKISTREKLYSKIGGFTTAISIQYLLDVLYACLFNRDYEKNMQFKLNNSLNIETGRFSTTEILAEDKNKTTSTG